MQKQIKGQQKKKQARGEAGTVPNYQGPTVATSVMRKWCELRGLPKADPETTVWVPVVYLRGNTGKHK